MSTAASSFSTSSSSCRAWGSDLRGSVAGTNGGRDLSLRGLGVLLRVYGVTYNRHLSEYTYTYTDYVCVCV